MLAYLPEPVSAITTDAGHILVANWNTDTVTVLNQDGTVAELIESAELLDEDDSGVAGLAVGPGGLIYLTKPALGLVKVIDPDGATVRTVELGGSPWAVTVAANGLVYVTDFDSPGVSVLSATGDLVRTIVLPPGASPSDVAVDADGRVHVSYLGPEGGVIAVATAVPVVGLGATAIGEPVFGSPGSQDDPSGPVVVADVVYQVVTDVDAESGLPRTGVAVIAADGVTTLAYAPAAGRCPGPGVSTASSTRRSATSTTGPKATDPVCWQCGRTARPPSPGSSSACRWVARCRSVNGYTSAFGPRRRHRRVRHHGAGAGGTGAC